MTQDEIIEMVHQYGDWNGETAEFNDVGLKYFFDAAFTAGVTHGLKACVTVCESLVGTRAYAWHCADAIRYLIKENSSE